MAIQLLEISDGGASALGHDSVDPVAVMRREIEELDVESGLELAVAYDSGSADLMSSGKTKLKSDSRPVQRWNKALDENALGSQI